MTKLHSSCSALMLESLLQVLMLMKGVAHKPLKIQRSISELQQVCERLMVTQWLGFASERLETLLPSRLLQDKKVVTNKM